MFCPSPRKLIRVDGAGPEIDRLWADLRRHFPFAAIRDRAFVDWRFFRNPTRKYRVYVFRSKVSKRPRAYAAVGIDGETAKLVDLLAPPDQQLVAEFAGQIAADLSEHGIAVLETWMPAAHFLSQMLIGAGWVRQSEPLGIVPTARSFDERLTIPWTSDSFLYTMADSDLM